MKFLILSSILALATAVSAFTGPATFLLPTGKAGTCGYAISSGDFAVALNPSDYASGAHCGKAISVTYMGNTITTIVQDECSSCGPHGIDLIARTWKAITETAAAPGITFLTEPGITVNLTWAFL
ncbi:hypothetical protein FB45DRAFT_1011200 [Roridomyces roridus]|uniref:RlpA-like protein double-psi beta-barrel domain-containing protein n=1 Tax=Roridomyces roridus TaxID=1738132 RepID=A0AAD7B206_9AGAR|nr:hypothetical protein FB45DRAFT_1011200 [Roridomyces roridus]